VSELQICVLGPIQARMDKAPLPMSKPRHREILGLLVAAHGRTVSTSSLIDDLWDAAPAGAVGAVRTFIGEIRRILEPTRPAHTPPTILTTRGTGYALEVPHSAVDLWRVERAVREVDRSSPEAAESSLSCALGEWGGTAFEEFSSRPWAAIERARIAKLRAGVIEHLARIRLTLDRLNDAVTLLEPHVEEYPWREEGWRLLAVALYRTGRQAEALALLRQARVTFVEGLGLDPSDRLTDLEHRIRHHDPKLGESDVGRSILMQAAAVQARAGARSQLESATTLLPLLAQSGSVNIATEQRLAAIAAAEQFNDPELTARVIAGYDVPGSWTRSDDPNRSAAIVDAARRTISVLPPTASERVRARLLATTAMESRGTANRLAEASEAEQIARRLGDPALLCFALSSRYLQSFETTGQARRRAELGAEITSLAVSADLPTFEIEGRLIRMQALCALDDVRSASAEADLVDKLAARFERPLASVFTAWFRYTFEHGPNPPGGSEMPGFRIGLSEMSRLTTSVRAGKELHGNDFGPYLPWTLPLVMASKNQLDKASAALDSVPDPPHDLMSEVCWYLIGLAAIAAGHRGAARRAYDALLPAAGERAGGSGAIDLGPISPLLDRLPAVWLQARWKGGPV